ncbi:MAG: DUF3800 domain-containing protein [Acidobacteriota bacterium]
MSAYSDFVVYVDESGDHSLAHPDQNYPVFVLAFCVFEKNDYVARTVPAVQDFKFSYFGHDMVVLHERDIRKRKGPFRILADKDTEEQFQRRLSQVMSDSDFTVIASVIRKQDLAQRYEYPANPYELALSFCLERLFLFLKDNNSADGSKVHVVFERRGKKEDSSLELHFRRVCAGQHSLRHVPDNLPFEPVFAAKSVNSTGMQIADLVARPIGRFVLAPQQSNRAYEIIQRKLRHRPGQADAIGGYGLKIFP